MRFLEAKDWNTFCIWSLQRIIEGKQNQTPQQVRKEAIQNRKGKAETTAARERKQKRRKRHKLSQRARAQNGPNANTYPLCNKHGSALL